MVVTPAPKNHSLLRSLIPFTILGAGPVANLYRAAFLHRKQLVRNMLQRLEGVDTAVHPRAVLAEAIQRLLQGTLLQRDLRPLFENAEIAFRRELNAHNCRCTTDPQYRLDTFQLWMAAAFYSDMLAVSADPFFNAEIRLYSAVTSDIGNDELFKKLYCAFESDETRPSVPPEFCEAIGEMFLLERDLFGKFRFDSRKGAKYLTHSIRLDAVGHNEASASLLNDDVVKELGNFHMNSVVIGNGRWREYTLWCGEEDHRLIDTLPPKEKINVGGEGWSHDIILTYDTPLCTRTHEVDAGLLRTGQAYIEKFEIPVPQQRSWLARKFLDR